MNLWYRHMPKDNIFSPVRLKSCGAKKTKTSLDLSLLISLHKPVMIDLVCDYINKTATKLYNTV